jgi:cupin 2 domain-containing protein
MIKNNIFAAVESSPDAEHVLELLRTQGLLVERIVSKGHKSPEHGWYDQALAEWVMLLSGAAEIEFASGTTVKLLPGDYLNIAARNKHRVSWTAPDTESVWLAIHYAQEASG